MFFKISRYWKLPDVISTDEKDRTLESKSLRLPLRVSGTFSHTVEDVDRLDHLAHKYYKQPRKWWRICDANPEFTAPPALLGKGPVKTARFYLNFSGNGANPPWHELIARLLKETGVEKAMLIENINLFPDYVFQVDDQSLLDLQADGVPDDVLTELESIKDQIFIGRKEFAGVLESMLEYDSVEAFISLALRHARVTLDGEVVTFHIQSLEHAVLVEYNQINTDFETLSNVIIDVGFIIDKSETIGQIGKSIIIPPDITR